VTETAIGAVLIRFNRPHMSSVATLERGRYESDRYRSWHWFEGDT
jgi:hypothetical protein